MTKAKYQFRNPIGHYDPDVVGNALEAIRLKYGGQLKVEYVIEESKDPKHPLHPIFMWDDAKAGHEYRKEQARYLIRVVTVVYDKEPIPAFVNVSVDNGRGSKERYYQSISVLTVDEYQQALTYANGELRAAVRSLEQLKKVAPNQTKKKHIQTAIGYVEKAKRRI